MNLYELLAQAGQFHGSTGYRSVPLSPQGGTFFSPSLVLSLGAHVCHQETGCGGKR